MAEAARKIDDDPYGYFADEYLWAKEQARLLRAGLFQQVDIEHVAEEIEGVGNQNRNAIKNQIARIVRHLIKLEFSTADYPRLEWLRSIRDARREVGYIVDDVPSLRGYPAEIFKRAHESGLTRAVEDLDLRRELDREQSDAALDRQYTIDQVLGEWLPPERPR